MANLFEPEWQYENDQPPWLVRVARVGAQAGAERLGASVYEIDAGGRASPLHVHYANEELVVVLSGRPSLRTADGTRDLAVGEVVACPTGLRGAHRVENNSDEPARVLIVSTMIFPEVVTHLDSDKVLVLTGAPEQVGEDGVVAAFPRSHAVEPMAGETE